MRRPDIETQWEHCKKLWHDTCEEILGKKKTQHKEWISADTIHKLETRRERKTVLNNSQTRAAKAKGTGRVHSSGQRSKEEHQEGQEGLHR